MLNIKFPERKNTLCARTLARLLIGEHLKHRDADLVSGSYRLSGYVHYLQERYGWRIERKECITDTGDPVGRNAPYTVYWLSDEVLSWSGQMGRDWAADVLRLEKERIAGREAGTSHPAEKKGFAANSLDNQHSTPPDALTGGGGAHGSN